MGCTAQSSGQPCTRALHHSALKMQPTIGLVIDPWDFPFNGTVVSTRRFVAALSNQFHFKILKMGNAPEQIAQNEFHFSKLSIPGANRIIDQMQAPLARPNRRLLEVVIADCDLIHVQYPFLLAHQAIRTARLLGKPVISSFHVQPENIQRNLRLNQAFVTRWLYRLFVSQFYQASDRVIAPSEFAKTLLTQHGVSRPIDVLSNGVTADFFASSRHHVRSDQFQILSVGRLAQEKQQSLLLKAVARSQYRAKIHVTLAGTGPAEVDLKTLAVKLGVRATIGRVTDDQLHDLYAAADVFVQCSRVELEGMSALEAMAAGCPTLLNRTETSALSELIQDPLGAFTDEAPNILTQKLDALLSNPDARQFLTDRNQAFALTRRHEDSAVQLANLYRHTLLGESNFVDGTRVATDRQAS
jgi:1,2-diacylglycerol 3-alpha-glucosyltransferase